MNPATLERAIWAAQDFLAVASRMEITAVPVTDKLLQRTVVHKYLEQGTKRSGALRRRSLDLTRTLADLRAGR